MRAALAYKPEHAEVPVSSTEVLESNVIALNGAFSDLKADFKEHRKEFNAAIARLDNDIKSAVTELRAEIRAMVANAESDLKDFAGRVEAQLSQMRAEDTSQRDKVDRNYESLSDKIDRNYESLSDKIDQNCEVLNGKIAGTNVKLDATNDQLADLTKTVNKMDSKLNALSWVIGGSIAVGTFVITVGKAVGWF